jgi:hypothetical protein
MYEVLRKGRIHNLSIKCQLDLFDKIVKNILLYGCEIYTIKLGVDTFRRNKSLQNFKWTLSIISFLPNPQISHPYNKIFFTILSNKSNWHLIDKLCILPFLNTSYMALIPLFTGFGKNDIIERVHLKFCKLLLRLKVSTPNFMVYRELGRYPLEIDITVRMISYWCKLIQGKQSKLSTITYKLLYAKN